VCSSDLSVIQTSRRQGMIAMDDSIMDLLQRKWIGPDEAYEKAADKKRFAPLLKNPPPEW
jgi:twitching motility protein PilT